MWLLLAALPSLACSRLPAAEHVPVPDTGDITAPSAAVVELLEIWRGTGGEYDPATCTVTSNSCADSGGIELGVAATDDVTPADALGWRIELVGTLPDGLVQSDVAWRADEEGVVVLSWGDGSTDDQEAFSFTARVYAVDSAGNESAPTDLLVEHAGSISTAYGACGATAAPVPKGCATTRPFPGMGWILALLGLRRRGR